MGRHRWTRAQVWLLAGVLASSLGCRVLRNGEWARRDKCAATIPFLRAEPDRPYRVVKVLEEESDDKLAWEACAEHADALLALGLSGGTTTRGVGVGGKVAIFKGSTSPSNKVSGLAIRFEAPPQAEPASPK
jgi:hypothetical protein